jgi:hypothetical protein
MSLEKQELIAADAPHELDAEHIWGGEEWEWKNWQNAHRDMGVNAYNLRQIEEAMSIKTREAFMAENHREPGDDNELMQFFINKGGARWFKRRFFQYRSDMSEQDIARYYEGKYWEEKEKNDTAKF